MAGLITVTELRVAMGRSVVIRRGGWNMTVEQSTTLSEVGRQGRVWWWGTMQQLPG